MEVEIIGTVRSCFSEKFGIPRQPGLVRSATGYIELIQPFDSPEMLRGLEKFSHVWVLFIFHQAMAAGYRSTARPPRMGGQKRIGIYGCRSPHRPNHIGMSALCLDRVVADSHPRRIEVSGLDLLDGTPVIDIKPYIPYSDSHPDAVDGFPAVSSVESVRVEFSEQAQRFCGEYYHRTGRELDRLIKEILQNDPRPASQKGKKQEFGMLLWGVNVRYQVQQSGVRVVSCENR